MMPTRTPVRVVREVPGFFISLSFLTRFLDWAKEEQGKDGSENSEIGRSRTSRTSRSEPASPPLELFHPWPATRHRSPRWECFTLPPQEEPKT